MTDDTTPTNGAPTSDVDWDAIRRRMEELETALEANCGRTGEMRRAILRERARTIGRVKQDDAADQSMLSILIFDLAHEHHGLEAAFVREVVPIADFTPVPGTPEHVVGIVSIRGSIISVVDLRTFFGLPARGLGQLNTIIVLRNEDMEFGVLADAIIGVRSVHLDEEQASRDRLRDIGAEYLQGVTADGVIVLDADRILRDDRMLVHHDAFSSLS